MLCSMFVCTDEHYLVSQPQRRRESSAFIDLFTAFVTQCVFNVNLYANENLV